MEKPQITINIGSFIKDYHISTATIEPEKLLKLEGELLTMFMQVVKNVEMADTTTTVNTKEIQARKIANLSGELNKEIEKGKVLGLQIEVEVSNSVASVLNGPVCLSISNF